MKHLKPLFLSLFLAAAAVSGASAQSIGQGKPAPDFTLTLADGTSVRLSDYRGKAVLLHFWATWCPPCRRELPNMNRLADQLKTEGSKAKLVFLAVCVSDEESVRSDFKKKNKYTFPGGLDKNDKIAQSYEIQAIPASFLISPDGKIERMTAGAMEKKDLSDFIGKYERF